jgi:hypothetical protein
MAQVAFLRFMLTTLVIANIQAAMIDSGSHEGNYFWTFVKFCENKIF